MPRIESLEVAVPDHRYTQREIREMCAEFYGPREDLRPLLDVFDRAGIETRHLAFPLSYYRQGKNFDERNGDFAREGLTLLERAATAALCRADLAPSRIDHVFFVTTTGLATPSLDARLAHRMGFRTDVGRSPLFGLGCAGGVAALSRASDYVTAHPERRALVLSLELCGQVFSPRALTRTDVIGSALFADGAAAAVVAGDRAPGPRGPAIRATRSSLFPGTEEVMGWRFTSDGMRLILSEAVPDVIREHLRPALAGFLSDAGLTPDDIRHWALHPGGPKVLEAYANHLGLSSEALAPVRACLRDYGNLSSAAALFTLLSVMPKAQPGEWGMMVALGPGFSAEMLLLEC